LTLEEIAPGARVFVDAPIFVYHFTGVSAECRDFLARCENAELDALTSSLVVAEVAHRLMTIEAVATGLVAPGNVVRKLRENPDLVRRLGRYQEQVERIPLMSVDVVAVEAGTLLRSGDVRSRYGLLVNDSLVVTSALDHGAQAIATSDRDFAAVEELRWHSPSDLS
jgi:predicted nucleic acid-binding protein